MEQLIQEELKSMDRLESLKLILNCIDLTTLSGDDTDEKVLALCEKAMAYPSKNINLPTTAALCFYPNFAAIASEKLKDSNLQLACVAGAFPSGQSPLNIRIQEVEYAVKNGANEIDMVISRGKFLEGDYDFIAHEIREHKKACGNAHLKVILETGELIKPEYIKKASEIAIENGADFIKTSTGKIPVAATLEAFNIMINVIKEHYQKTGAMIGIKPAGGISDAETALKYLALLKAVLGPKWMNNTYFRIGASRLADDVAGEVLKLI